MDAARRDELKILFAQALALPPAQRIPYLDAACGDDAAGRAELASLLDAYDKAPGYFERLSGTALPIAPVEEPRQDPPHTDPYGLIGRHIDPYQIVSVLGGGGMGVVYKARHRTLDRLAALKFLPPHLSADVDAKTRLLHEARAASALDHPNLCTIYDVGETDTGQLFIAMAFYAGETLKAKLKRRPLPLRDALHYTRQVAEGLAHAHTHGIVHRDVKPANILITDNEVAKILDFGLAKVADVHLTRIGATMGTVAYMSPEQARGQAVDHQTDLWSLGVVLYELLAGKRPFQGDREQAIMYSLLHAPPAPITRLKDDLPPVVERLVGRCLEKNKDRRYQTCRDFLLDLHRVQRQLRTGFVASSSPVPATGRFSFQAPQPSDGRSQDLPAALFTPRSDPMRRSHVFLSYKRGAEPDERVAEALYEALSEQHDVFCTDMHIGTRWVEHLEAELARSDYLIILLSARSVHSEMVQGEIELAHHLAKEQGGRPAILPVRVAYRHPFAYPLSVYLDALNWTYWERDEDTPRLIAALQRAISSGSLPAPPPYPPHAPPEPPSPVIPEPPAAAQPSLHLELPEGTMAPQSAFYVKRLEDDVALHAIAQQGVTITIKGPRQMGKSSLLMQTMAAAARRGKEVVYLDFQLVDRATLEDPDRFFRQFCRWISDDLNLNDQTEVYWRQPLGNSQRCTRYLDRYLLKTLGRPLLLAMDEVERVFDTAFRSDFFSMLRSWHNDRAVKPCWRQLDLALVTSTEPYQLIENLNQSPFNVGEVIALNDFSHEQVDDLNERHGAPLSDDYVHQLMDLVAGHPYLVRKALYLTTTRRISIDDLLDTAADEDGPFGDHLRYHLFRLHGQADLMHGLRQVLREQSCDDVEIFWRLQGAGLIRRAGRDVLPRCPLYAAYFREHLHA